MKKKTYIILTAGVLLVLLGVGIFWYVSSQSDDDGGLMQYTRMLVEGYNPKIYLYGEPLPELPEELGCMTIDRIDESIFQKDGEHGIYAIILNDLEGTIELSDEELLLIKRHVEEDGFDMYYLGRGYLDDFIRLGFTVGVEDDECGLEYIGSTHIGQEVQQNGVGNLYAEHGILREEDVRAKDHGRQSAVENIIYFMYDHTQEAEREGK